VNRVEILMVAVSLTSFGAGLGVGMAAPQLSAHSVWDERPGAEARERYIERYRERFDLRPDQIRDLRAILLSLHDEEVRITTGADYAEWPPRLKNQLVQARQQADRRIVYILDEEQRAKYRALNK